MGVSEAIFIVSHPSIKFETMPRGAISGPSEADALVSFLIRRICSFFIPLGERVC